MTFNLKIDYKKLVQNLDNKFYQDKIYNSEKLIQVYEILNIYPQNTVYSVSNRLEDYSFKFKLIKQVKLLKSNRGIRKLLHYRRSLKAHKTDNILKGI